MDLDRFWLSSGHGQTDVVIDALIGADVSVFVDRGYQGVGGTIRR
jgi:hypothetical protein